MKVAVCVKHAIDESELRFGPEGSPVLEGTPMKLSTFDKNAVEEALTLRAQQGGEVVAFASGPPDAKKSLKEALAMGADRGVLVLSEAVDSLATARLLASAIRREGPFDVILCSEGSSDTYSGQVPPMLSQLLGTPFVGYVRKLEVGQGVAKAERALEDTVESVEVAVPFTASVVSEINEPRYPTLIQIMQASKKPVTEVSDPAGAQQSHVRVDSLRAQKTSRKLQLVEGTPDEAAAELVRLLEKAGVL